VDHILKTDGVSKSFAGKLAVDGVSITMAQGDIYGFIGENGAGKTTLMRMVCGLAAPTGGSIELFGSKNLVAQRHKVGCTIENPAIYPSMTAIENMEVQRLTLGLKDNKVCGELLELADNANTGKKKARDFSLGMKQRLMVALALLGDPELLVLDEPTNGLDPVGIKEVRDIFSRLNHERGISILVSSHILGELEKLATRYGVISQGKLVDEFSAEEVAGRVAKNLLIETADAAKTPEEIGRLLPDARLQSTPDQGVRITGHVEQAGEINKQLVQAGVTVKALIPEGQSLESYFLKLMVGGHNA